MYYDLSKDIFIKEKQSKSLNILYNTILGRILLKLATSKAISNLCAKYMNSKFSKRKIKKFIKNNSINMDEYKEKDYTSFNDFFIRELKPNKRTIADNLIAVCDSKLSIFKIEDDSTFNIKNSIYTVEELIGEKKEYKYALVFRLCVDNYHHYIFPDDGKIIKTKKFNGILHTVQPIAQKKYKVFHENSRNITFLNCNTLGDVCYIEVGALLVGKIVNIDKNTFKKGEEKGHFEFGGSTVIMLLNKDIDFNKRILENSKNEIETIIKMGQCIGKYK